MKCSNCRKYKLLIWKGAANLPFCSSKKVFNSYDRVTNAIFDIMQFMRNAIFWQAIALHIANINLSNSFLYTVILYPCIYFWHWSIKTFPDFLYESEPWKAIFVGRAFTFGFLVSYFSLLKICALIIKPFQTNSIIQGFR